MTTNSEYNEKDCSNISRKITLRREKKPDWKTVEQITYRAFLNTGHAGGNEALLAQKLRDCPVFVPELDYVAELDHAIIGNIMYTKSKVVNDHGEEWETLTFGPVSVLPKYQREGVGSALILQTLQIARTMGYRAVIIFGHESYYPRFGFKPASDFSITTVDGTNFSAFMALPLWEGSLDGVHGRFICDDVYFTLDQGASDKLNAKLADPMNIDEYIERQQLSHQRLLSQVREAIRRALPEVMEKISYQMPTYWQGQNLIRFAAQKSHIGI